MIYLLGETSADDLDFLHETFYDMDRQAWTCLVLGETFGDDLDFLHETFYDMGR